VHFVIMQMAHKMQIPLVLQCTHIHNSQPERDTEANNKAALNLKTSFARALRLMATHDFYCAASDETKEMECVK
jgi:hypothetical protein